MRLAQTLIAPGPYIPDRYDEGVLPEDQFDFDKRRVPKSRLHKTARDFYDENAERRTGTVGLTKTIALAEISLKLRGLAGIVLGSVARELINPPAIIDDVNGRHKDLDVLVLPTYSRHHPAPSECGVDWFVRPKNRPPTNGRINTWYDLQISDQRVIPKRGGTRVSDMGPFRLRGKGDDARVEFKKQWAHTADLTGAVRGKAKQIFIEPGLYLPDPRTMRTIIDHCNGRTQLAQDIFITVEEHLSALEGMTHDEAHFLEQLTTFQTEFQILCMLLGDSDLLKITNNDRVKLDSPDDICQLYDSRLRQLRMLMSKNTKDFEYLAMDDLDTRKALFTVMPDELLTFRPTH